MNGVVVGEYLESVLQKMDSFEGEMKNIIKQAWIKSREESGVLRDKRTRIKLKDTFYKTVVWPEMMYGSDCWTLDKK